MLSEKTISTVKATAPILEEHGETLTRHFYKRMFEHNPEVKPFFNQTNQGKGNQQRALAGAVCAYAANIDNLGVLGDAVELIAQKHASLRITAQQYPIVGENLLASIKEVLGDGATDDIINAWGEAYGVLADILIKREAEIYDQQEAMPDGWRDFKNFKVVRKEKESDNITSFYLAPENGDNVPDFKAGQYITVRVPSPCGHTTMRNYSLSNQPGQDHFRISVKREDGNDAGTAEGFVSNMLHRHVEEGSVLEIAPPCGEFTLKTNGDASKPLVLMAAGVGITPILSMLLEALDKMPTRQIIFIHANMSEKTHAFKNIIDSLANANTNLTALYRYSDDRNAAGENVSQGFVDAEMIESVLPDHQGEFYFCGPKPFMASVYQTLTNWNVPAENVNFEFFGPLQDLQKAA